MLLGGVAGELAMLPDAGEFLEFVSRDLVIGRVGGLFFVVEMRRAGDGAAAGAEDALRIFFLGPPEHLVEPMDAPIAERAVGVIEKIAPAAGMKFAVERAQRRGAAPEIPIHIFGGALLRLRVFVAAAAVGEKAHHADFADCCRISGTSSR